jgi:hypothetical protein
LVLVRAWILERMVHSEPSEVGFKTGGEAVRASDGTRADAARRSDGNDTTNDTTQGNANQVSHKALSLPRERGQVQKRRRLLDSAPDFDYHSSGSNSCLFRFVFATATGFLAAGLRASLREFTTSLRNWKKSRGSYCSCSLLSEQGKSWNHAGSCWTHHISRGVYSHYSHRSHGLTVLSLTHSLESNDVKGATRERGSEWPISKA